VLVEYAFLLTAFGIPAVLGCIAGGVKLYANYQSAKAAILSPLP
jgi:hypothetical protein